MRIYLKQASYIIRHISAEVYPWGVHTSSLVSLSQKPPGAGWLDDLADRWAAGAWQFRYSADDASNATGRNMGWPQGCQVATLF